MYNLLVTADDTAWKSDRDSISMIRFGEYTAESIRARYRPLDETAISDLTSFPTLFAYEQQCELPARVGKVTRIVRPSAGEVRFEYKLLDQVRPIPVDQLLHLAWDLDINNWEMNRTHWAIKDVDLIRILKDKGYMAAPSLRETPGGSLSQPAKVADEVTVSPSVFAIPPETQQSDLVSAMMPFGPDFTNVYCAIQTAATKAGFMCQRADDIWEDSSIVQDVFSLIYRSAVVVVDLSGQNPNVMYETGIAHTLGRPVVPIANSLERLPFDLAHHRTLGYLPNGEGLRDLTERLASRLSHFKR